MTAKSGRKPGSRPVYDTGRPAPADSGQWKRWAACRGVDPELFFPRRRVEAERFARKYCAECPVIGACHDVAERTKSQGLFAGMWWTFSGKPVPLIPAAKALLARRAA